MNHTGITELAATVALALDGADLVVPAADATPAEVDASPIAVAVKTALAAALAGVEEAHIKVRAARGGEAALAFPYKNPFCMALLHGRAGRLTAENGGFRPGQAAGVAALRRELVGAGLCRSVALYELLIHFIPDSVT